MTWCKDKTMSQRRIMVVPMALRLCQGVERDCFVHNSTTTWTRLGSALACRHFSFFFFSFAFQLSLSVSLLFLSLCAQRLYPLRGGHAESAAVAALAMASKTWGSCESERKEPGADQWATPMDGRRTGKRSRSEKGRKSLKRERVRACI
jgi:hypothetical protein